MIQFRRFSDYAPGQLVSMLIQSYASYFDDEPECRAAWVPGWEQYDHAVFAHPSTVGAGGFVRMYQACGFREVGRTCSEYPTVDYVLNLEIT